MRIKFLPKFVVPILIVLAVGDFAAAQSQLRSVSKPVAPRTITIVTEPKAAVWLDDLRRGTTDDKGQLKIEKVGSGAKRLRVRAVGFAEQTQTLSATSPGEVKVSLTKTTDPAELAFQQAEVIRESGRETEKAAEGYRTALKLRPTFAEAHLGLARLIEKSDFDEALAQIAAARRDRPNFAEASAAEGRIYLENSDTDNAIKSFQRAIREAKNFQPEAHTGLARAFESKGEMAKAIVEFKIALVQLGDSEPAVYQLLGEAYEKMRRTKEAIAAYEKFLQLAPGSNQASAVRSIIEQLKKPNSGDTLELMPQ